MQPRTYQPRSAQSQTDTLNPAMSSKSRSTSASASQSPYGSFDLMLAQAKHELIVTLMSEVCALFDTEWKVNVQKGAPS